MSRTRTGSPLHPSPTPRSPARPPKAPAQTQKTEKHANASPPKQSISLREAIALKRAEAKKAQMRTGSTALDSNTSNEDTLPEVRKEDEESLDLGRWSVRETIERAKSTGEYASVGGGF